MYSEINFNKAHFTQSAPSIRECPPETGVEVAFAGRSNAGKSSAINALTNNNKLARTSKTPGRTQLINFFALSETQRLVDLPGYGYAKVSRELKERWQRYLSEYLQNRQTLYGLVLLMDIRHPLQEFDTTMLKWAKNANMPVHMLLTKADKLSRGAAATTLAQVLKQVRAAGMGDLVTGQCFSSLKNQGVDELKTVLRAWLNPFEENETEIEPENQG